MSARLRILEVFTGPPRIELEIPLSGHRRAWVVYPGDLTEADAERVCSMVRALPMPTERKDER